jgi:hypothetical protein
MSDYSVLTLLRAGSGLAASWSRIVWVLSTAYKIHNFEISSE